jgi:antitoxin component of RelBE/YafQ-DinJ toxin-antitoxin module
MAKRAFTSSIDDKVANQFKMACDQRGLKTGMVLELFMKQFASNEFVIKATEHGMFLELNFMKMKG